MRRRSRTPRWLASRSLHDPVIAWVAAHMFTHPMHLPYEHLCVACTHACMQEAFIAAATSTQPADAAALQALQSSFPTAGFELRVG